MNKNIKLIAGAVGMFVAVAALTFGLLTIIFPKTADTDKPAVSKATSPKEIIEAFNKPGAISGLDQYSRVEQSTPGMNTINYTKPGSYLITVIATDVAAYEQKDSQKEDNEATTVSAVEALLTKLGLTKATATASAYRVFDSENSVCQLLTLPKMSTRPASVNLSCADIATVSKAYEEIDTLLALQQKATSTQTKPTSIQKVTVSEGNKTLVTLNTFGDEPNTKTLLFAAINDTWEYLGERPLSTGTTEGSPTILDRTLSNDLKAKIADPKYEGFLQKYVI